jgi:DNA-binding transcriptional regulator YdaS (Cro superfamily)
MALGYCISMSYGYTTGPMDKLRDFLNAMSLREQTQFAWDVGTTIGYMRRCICISRALSLEVCSEIERVSRGHVCIEDLRPDLDVSHLRQRRPRRAT